MQATYWATDPADAVRQFRYYRGWIDFHSLTWVNAMRQEPPRTQASQEGGGG